MGSQIDVMNRMITRLSLVTDHTCESMGRDMQQDGEGLYAQPFTTTRAVNDDELAAFPEQVKAQDQPLAPCMEGTEAAEQL